MESAEIVNRVSQSSLITLDLEELYQSGERLAWDIGPYLFQGFMLREKDFRAFISAHNWQEYAGKNIALYCSTDAIVPTWAYMLLTLAMQPFANHIIFGSLAELEDALYVKALSEINLDRYRNARVVIKGCSKVAVPVAAYVEATRLLRPIAASIMFGEPCSTVPLFKKPKN
jgi:Protein of unknown function (DUF2480)